MDGDIGDEIVLEEVFSTFSQFYNLSCICRYC